MPVRRKKLYLILLTACVAGYIWFFYNFYQNQTNSNTTICLIKRVTNIPCPSCGTTRAIDALINGHFFQSVILNPLGLLVAVCMIIIPFWIIKDLITKKNSFLHFYLKTEVQLKKPQIAIPLILLIIINWIWNIYKEL